MCVHKEKIYVVGRQPSVNVETMDDKAREDLKLLYTLDTRKIRFPKERTKKRAVIEKCTISVIPSISGSMS